MIIYLHDSHIRCDLQLCDINSELFLRKLFKLLVLVTQVSVMEWLGLSAWQSLLRGPSALWALHWERLFFVGFASNNDIIITMHASPLTDWLIWETNKVKVKTFQSVLPSQMLNYFLVFCWFYMVRIVSFQIWSEERERHKYKSRFLISGWMKF